MTTIGINFLLGWRRRIAYHPAWKGNWSGAGRFRRGSRSGFSLVLRNSSAGCLLRLLTALMW